MALNVSNILATHWKGYPKLKTLYDAAKILFADLQKLQGTSELVQSQSFQFHIMFPMALGEFAIDGYIFTITVVYFIAEMFHL